MPLEDILNRIEAEARKEQEEIISKAQEEAKIILDDAKRQTDSILNASKMKAKEEAELMKKEKISSATLDARINIERSIEEIENNYIEEVKSRLVKFRSSNEYYSFIQRNIEGAWKVLGPGSIAYVEGKDVKKLKENGLQLTILPKEIDSFGGTVVTSADGRLTIDLTFSEILRKKEEEILKIVRDSIR